MRYDSVSCLLFVSLIATFAALLSAQIGSPTASIRGLITDASGAGVPGALVSATQVDTNLRRITRSDANGEFLFAVLPIGSWTVQVEALGFARAQTTAFLISPGQTAFQPMQLQTAGILEKLEVTAASGAVDLAASSATVALGYERIEEAPARSRNYLNFVLSAPGVAPSSGASSQRTMTGVRSAVPDTGFTFGGLRPRNNSIRIDGMDNRDETTGGNRVAVGLEMVQEFAVSSTAVGAELGGAAGGLLNMVTRSGVNLWHGDATFFLQNGSTNAKRPEIDLPEKPGFRRYQPGVSGMGPLRRDRTFIAAAFEHERESADELSNVPSGFFTPVAPDVSRRLYPTTSTGNELSAKMDHQISDADTMALRYAFSRGRVRHEVQGPENFADRSAQGSSLAADHSIVGNWLRVTGPSLVSDLRAQFGQRSMQLRPNGAGPLFEIPGVVSFGAHPRLDADRTERHYQLVQTVNYSRGAHHWNGGGDFHLVTLDASLRHRFAGLFVFPSLAAFEQGRPDLFVQAIGDPHTQFRTAPVGLWLQDRWEVGRGLTITAGTRYEYQTLPAVLPRSSQNIAPRFGVAWRPKPKQPLVIRIGMGLFHDRYPLAWLNEAIQKDGRQAFEIYASGVDAIRAFRSRPTVYSGGVPSRYFASRLRSTHGRKFTAGFEYEIAKDTSLSLEAAAIDGFHLPGIRNAALSLPPQYALETAARSSYAGATITLNRRLTSDFAALLSYTLARTRDNSSDFDEHPQDPGNLRANWALSRQHQLHRVTASGLFELPVEDKPLPGLLREVLEDISIAPIFSTGSGRPINALLTTDRSGAYPIAARPVDLARNPFRSPRQVNLDIRVMKTIPVLENRAKFQFGVESFNLLNHTNVERVSQFYQVGETRLPTYGGILESLPARQVQVMAQLEF